MPNHALPANKFFIFSIISIKFSEICRYRRVIGPVVTTTATEISEKLMRVCTERRGKPVELRIHYRAAVEKGCTVFTILAMEEVD
jgi:hypothetical protein